MTYTYDSLYRLTGESVSGDAGGVNGVVGYTYDDVGNRQSRTSTLPGVNSQSFAYDKNDRLTSDTTDANGNTKQSNGNAYNYDFENRLTSVNGGSIIYAYDGDGNRVSKTVGGITTTYLVDTNNLTGYAQVVEESQGGTVTRQYTYGHDLISQRQLISGNWVVSYYGYDGHGSVRLLTDTSGAVTDTYTYDAFGSLIARTGSTPNEYLYAGQRRDGETGLDYLRARYMNPSTGRFQTMDSYEGCRCEPKSLHKYVYANADPVGNVDPTGHFTVTQLAVTGAVIGALASLSAFVLFSTLTDKYLPADAFSKRPDAAVMGFNWSYPIGKALVGRGGPLGAGLAAGLSFTSGIGGMDLVFPVNYKQTAWSYAFGGLSVGPGIIRDGRSINGYVGFVWNTSTASDYAGPFFCKSITPGSVIVPGFAGRAATICSSPAKLDGSPGAYSVTVSVAPASKITAQASGSRYWYLGDLGAGLRPNDDASAGGAIDGLINKWHEWVDEIGPPQ